MSRGVSSLLSSAASEGEGGADGDTYLTASDDSSSLFDDDMQRAERPSFSLLGSSDGLAEPKAGGAELHREDCTPEELNQRFQSQRLDSSSSSEPKTPSPILTPALTPKRPNPPQDPRDNPASPKQPRLRTPAGLGLMKKHLSQPPVSSEAAHGQTRNALSLLRPLRPHETDLDQEQEQEVGMETGRGTPPQAPPSSQASLTWETSPDSGTDVSPERERDSSAPGNKPPTPPLHRLPSWVRNWNISLQLL